MQEREGNNKFINFFEPTETEEIKYWTLPCVQRLFQLDYFVLSPKQRSFVAEIIQAASLADNEDVKVNFQLFAERLFEPAFPTDKKALELRQKRVDKVVEELLEYAKISDIRDWNCSLILHKLWDIDKDFQCPVWCPLNVIEAIEHFQKVKPLLTDPLLLLKIVKTIGKYVAGEKLNVARIYLACIYRYKKPIWISLSGEPRGGKDTVVENTLRYFSDVLWSLRFSEHGLEYMESKDEINLTGKIIYAIDEKGIQNAIDTLKPHFGRPNMISEVRTVVKTRKGRLIGRKIRIKGCPVLIWTAPTPQMSDAIAKRVWFCNIDGSEAQTKAVFKKEAEKRIFPWQFEEEDETEKLIRLVDIFVNWPDVRDKLKIINVLSSYLAETFPSDTVRFRGDFARLNDMIEAVCWLHRFQRPILASRDEKYQAVITIRRDFEIAKVLLQDILEPSLMNMPKHVYEAYQKLLDEFSPDDEITVKRASEKLELPPPTVRKYLNLLYDIGYLDKAKVGRQNVYTILEEKMRTKEFLTLGDSFTKENLKKRLTKILFHEPWSIYYIKGEKYSIEDIDPLVEAVYDQEGEWFAEELRNFIQKG